MLCSCYWCFKRCLSKQNAIYIVIYCHVHIIYQSIWESLNFLGNILYASVESKLNLHFQTCQSAVYATRMENNCQPPMCFTLHHWANPTWVKMPRRMSSPPRPALKQAAGHDRSIKQKRLKIWGKNDQTAVDNSKVQVKECNFYRSLGYSKLFSNLPRINPIQLRVTSVYF